MSYSILFLACLLVPLGLCIGEPCFRAGVYEHIQINQFNDHVKNEDVFYYLRKNLQVYQHVTEQSRRKGVQLLVFPEGGLFRASDRSEVAKLAERIPNIETLTRPLIPCTDKWFKDTDQSPGILKFLSCLARDNHMYLVAAMADLQPCDDQHCPRDGYRIYNTAVAFDPKGILLQKYHKRHLFGEYNYDVPLKQELVTFDTPWGSMGLFICFDIIYRNPGLALIREKNVTTLLLPTAWFDEFPFLMSSQYHNAWAMGNNVNVLAANMKARAVRAIGSGIYSGKSGALIYKHDISGDGLPSLLIANVPVDPSKIQCDPNPQIVTMDYKTDQGKYPVKQIPLSEYSYVNLTKTILNEKVCNGSFCCSVVGKLRESNSNLVFGVTNHIRKSSTVTEFAWCEEACFLLVVEALGHISPASTARFEKLSIQATFTTESVYPSALTANVELLPANQWNVTSHGFAYELQTWTHNPISMVGLYGRCYDRDPPYVRDHKN